MRRIRQSCWRGLCAVALLALIAGTGCASVESVRMKQASKYVSKHPEIPEHLRDAVLKGLVVPGMTPEQAAMAAGVRTTEDPNHAMWEVVDGRLQFPPSVITSDTVFSRADTFSNTTQFQTSKPSLFIAYYDRDNRVERVQQAAPSDFLDGKSWIMPDAIPPLNFRTRIRYE